NGRWLLLQWKYCVPVAFLGETLKLERVKPELTKADWRDLIVQMTTVYGATNNKREFEAVLEYGLKKDPSYYRFHFIKARLYAFADNLDETIASLERAFMYQKLEPQS